MKKLTHRLSVGLLANQASVNSQYVPTADLLGKAGFQLKALFAPQHGFAGHTQANMIEVSHGKDVARRIPVYSLYSETRRPTPAMLKGLDMIIIDLQDVGARGYTFIWTMLYMLEACAPLDLPVLIIDRPNPIGGLAIEGPMLKREFFSFVGLHEIPMRHGMTLGELALMFNHERSLGVELDIEPLQGWQRDWFFEETGLPWVMPSPNIATPTTAVLYPGMELLEGTNLSEGRGTTHPFEFFGAPYLDGEVMAVELNRLKLPGVFFRAAAFQPTFDKWQGELCQGAQIHVTDPVKVKPVRTAVAILQTVLRGFAKEFRFNKPPYEYEKKLMPFDILAGSSELRQQLEKDVPLKTIVGSWETGCQQFKKRRRPYLLYSDR